MKERCSGMWEENIGLRYSFQLVEEGKKLFRILAELLPQKQCDAS